jgi:DNA-binding CsgD family transcriptional regulator
MYSNGIIGQSARRADANTCRQALALCSLDGELHFTTPHARLWLTEHFRMQPKAKHLPSVLRKWLAQPQGKRGQHRPLTNENKHAQLVVSLLRPTVDQAVCLVLERKNLGVPPARLRALGLTARQVEVLLWVSRGKTNGETAIILGMQPATVSKHLEQVFEKLGVDNRTAASGFVRDPGW